MSQTFEVRASGAADTAALAAMAPRQGWVEELLARVGEDYVLASAWQGDRAAGFGALNLAEGDLQPELGSMWVGADFRRQGVGRALSAWLEDEARRRGFKEVFLLVDAEKEAAAIPLYLELDYTPTGDHHRAEVIETGEQTVQAIYRKSLLINE